MLNQTPETRIDFYKRSKKMIVFLFSFILIISLTVSPSTKVYAVSGNNISEIKTATPQELANTIIDPESGIIPSNINYVGNNTQAGIFSGSNTVIGMDHGIVLTTGVAADILNTSETFDWGTNYQDISTNPGTDILIRNKQLNRTLLTGVEDSDLTAMGKNKSFDVNSLSFDFYPTTDTIQFNFVFASEEYPHFINKTGYPDAFGIFVNGVNTAVVPGTNNPINVNSVNNQFDRNPGYIIMNGGVWPGGMFTPPQYKFVYNGWTTVIPVIAKVNPNVKNTIKFAIADINLRYLDSALFINGFKSLPDHGSLELSKEIVGSAPANQTYTFTVAKDGVPATGTCTINGVLSNIPENGQIELKAGQKALLGALPAGDYQVTEKDPGSDCTTKYQIDAVDDNDDIGETYGLSAKKVAITNDKTTKVIFTNDYTPKSTLTITKEDSANSSKKLAGAIFEIWDTKGTTGISDDALVTQTAPTDANGKTNVSLSSGTYRFVETETPKYYKRPADGVISAAELTDTSADKGPENGFFTVNEPVETAKISNVKIPTGTLRKTTDVTRYHVGDDLTYTLKYTLPADLSSCSSLRLVDKYPSTHLNFKSATVHLDGTDLTGVVSADMTVTGEVGFTLSADQLAGYESGTIEMNLIFTVTNGGGSITNGAKAYITTNDGNTLGKDGNGDDDTSDSEYNNNNTDEATLDEGFKVIYDVSSADNGNDFAQDETVYMPSEPISVRDGTVLEKKGFKFKGWNNNSDGSGQNYVPHDTFSITENTTLYPVWEQIPTGNLEKTTDATEYYVGGDLIYTIKYTLPADISSYSSLRLVDKYPSSHLSFQSAAVKIDGTDLSDIVSADTSVQDKVGFTLTSDLLMGHESGTIEINLTFSVTSGGSDITNSAKAYITTTDGNTLGEDENGGDEDNAEYDENNTDDVTVKEGLIQHKLPMTGGSGVAIFIISGTLILGVALVFAGAIRYRTRR